MTHQQALDRMAAERYLLGEMSEAERHEFEAHYFDCIDCAEDVRLGEAIADETRRGRAAATKVSAAAKVLRPPFWRRPMNVVPWAAAAALALVAGYQSFVTVPELRNATTARALAPVMLRGATRGAEPVVTIAPGQTFVTVAGDVITDARTRELAYELLDSGSAAVVSGRTPVPPTGVPLMLLIPADELARSGRYTLVVRDAASGETVSEYPFVVAK